MFAFDPSEFLIQASGDYGVHAEDRWAAVLHVPCDEYVFGDEIEHGDEVDLATLLSLIEAHRCNAAETAGAR